MTDRTGATAVRTALQALLLAVAVAGHLLAPAGPLRALLVLPAVLWLPGRALVAGLGLARSAARFTPALSVALSVVAVIAGGLLTYLVAGHVPLAVLPLWVSGVLLPLNLLERGLPRPEPRPLLLGARTGVLYGAGVAATAGLLWLVGSHLPTTPQQAYLSFTLGSPYARTAGVLTVRQGENLRIPTAVTASKTANLTGYSVTALLDGRAVGSAPVTRTGSGSGTATLTVQAPKSCLHQIRLALVHSGTQLRSVDLYVNAGGSGHCGSS